MLFKQIRHSARKNRHDNSLFFSSLIIAIVAFYTLLSLEQQDIMQFLKSVESDSVQKLMTLVPIVYVISLFFTFFLVYFAYKYQSENRKKEYGLYLMHGMSRGRLFAMMIGETVFNSIISLLIGLPIALLITEGISLATVKFAGFGIVGHTVTFSPNALLYTAIGFIGVQIIAMLIISINICGKEIAQLINDIAAKKQKVVSEKVGWLNFIVGCSMLVIAYVLGVKKLKEFEFSIVLAILVIGTIGTFMLYKGLGSFIGKWITKKSRDKSGLYTFNSRQIHENVISEHKSLAVAALLIMLSMSLVCYGVGQSLNINTTVDRTVDFSIDATEKSIKEIMNNPKFADDIAACYPMKTEGVDLESSKVSWQGIVDSINKLPDSVEKTDTLNEIQLYMHPRAISQSSYNKLLKSIGRPEIKDNHVAMYSRLNGELSSVIEKALGQGAYMEIDGQRVEMAKKIYDENVVADRRITIALGFILPDNLYNKVVRDSEEILCWNMILKDDVVKKEGLMQAITDKSKVLDSMGLKYESYLKGMGRKMFYTVAGSYITMYLGVLFLIIANAVIGMKYLMQQRNSRRRYQNLIMLGTNKDELCKGSNKQIRSYFALVLVVASIDSVFAVWSLFTTFVLNKESVNQVLISVFVAFIVFIMIECIYIIVIQKASNKEIYSLDTGYEEE